MLLSNTRSQVFICSFILFDKYLSTCYGKGNGGAENIDEQSRQMTALMELRFWWGDKNT